MIYLYPHIEIVKYLSTDLPHRHHLSKIFARIHLCCCHGKRAAGQTQMDFATQVKLASSQNYKAEKKKRECSAGLCHQGQANLRKASLDFLCGGGSLPVLTLCFAFGFLFFCVLFSPQPTRYCRERRDQLKIQVRCCPLSQNKRGTASNHHGTNDRVDCTITSLIEA